MKKPPLPIPESKALGEPVDADLTPQRSLLHLRSQARTLSGGRLVDGMSKVDVLHSNAAASDNLFQRLHREFSYFFILFLFFVHWSCVSSKLRCFTGRFCFKLDQSMHN